MSVTQYWLFALRAQQFWEEGRDSSGRIPAGTWFHLSEGDVVWVSVLPQRPLVRARCGSAERPPDRHSGGVRGHNLQWAIGTLLHCGITMKQKCIAVNVLLFNCNKTAGRLYMCVSYKYQITIRIIQDVFCFMQFSNLGLIKCNLIYLCIYLYLIYKL